VSVTNCHHVMVACHVSITALTNCCPVLIAYIFLSQLSPNVIVGLHQIIQAIQQYDYQTGLACHTQMISQGNFSEICSFMPGVKMLLQTAMQLQVYVQ